MTTIWRVMFTMNAILLALLALSWPFVEPSSPAATIALVSLGFIVASMLGLAAIIRLEWEPFR
ncbi:hypothetical protein GWG54_11530 [Natronococcus sp. JC468]|uniref:hypothetical protein n=1 Tax=Natronococcus sp. JC468 TaxID=1961921 RepID=UPI001439295E|nr:hypothetical protein [Natronococcus sp. JC468]NKE36440.1 hypothetical protein [Natronococcus sp. JC468]